MSIPYQFIAKLLSRPRLSQAQREAAKAFGRLAEGDGCIGDDEQLYIFSQGVWVRYQLDGATVLDNPPVAKNAFVSNIQNQEARTENNMKALASTANPLVDLFFKIGASRGKDIIPDFVKAFVHDKEKAMRIALWARDCRGGAGERKLFRDILLYLEKSESDLFLEMKTPRGLHNFHETVSDSEYSSEGFRAALMRRITELGRFDDLLIFKTEKWQGAAFREIATALQQGNGLCAKWMPRKGPIAVKLTKYLKLSPKAYRKHLVALTKVVETQMCAKKWDEINFKHVPSLAASRYQKAFKRNTKKYEEYLELLKKGETTIHATTLYPYDVIKALDKGDIVASTAQWEALPNFMGDENMLAIVDTSGSMCSGVGGKNKDLLAIDIAVSLGLYMADKAKTAFKDVFMTFSYRPQLLQVKGDIAQKVNQMKKADWHGNTDFNAAIELILKYAIQFSVPKSDMPTTLVVLSDMQFDECVKYDDSAMEMIRRKYSKVGYDVPKIVFWNLRACDNVPVKFNENGVALVSGFSPSIMKSILKSKDFRPEAVMLETIMSDRYKIGA